MAANFNGGIIKPASLLEVAAFLSVYPVVRPLTELRTRSSLFSSMIGGDSILIGDSYGLSKPLAMSSCQSVDEAFYLLWGYRLQKMFRNYGKRNKKSPTISSVYTV